MEQSRKRILFLCDYQAPYGGNFIASLFVLDQKIVSRGAKAFYQFPKGAQDRAWCKKLFESGLSISFFEEQANVIKKTHALLKTIKDTDATILHVHFGGFPQAELAALCSPHLRLILHFHSDFSAGKSPSVHRRIRNYLKKLPEWILRKRLTKITVSETSAMTTRDCISLHNALVPERFAAELWTREQTRNFYQIPQNGVFALVFGWSPSIKGVDLAAEATARLRAETGLPIYLGIICGRAYPPERMKAFLAKNTVLTGEEPWIRLLPPEEDVFRYHLASDLFLSPSRSETFSYALLEALYTQRPCAVSDIPGVRWSDRFDTVHFFPSCDCAGMAKAMTDALRDGQAETFLVRAAAVRQEIVQDYGIDDWCRRLLEIYQL